jgi:hypothetical protein
MVTVAAGIVDGFRARAVMFAMVRQSFAEGISITRMGFWC